MSLARSHLATLGVALACACSLRSLDYLNDDDSRGNLDGTGGTVPEAGEGGESTTGGTSSGGTSSGGTSSGGSRTGGASGSAGSDPVGGSSPTGGSDAGGGVSQGGSTGATGGDAGSANGGAGASSGGSAGESGAGMGGSAGSGGSAGGGAGAGGSAGGGTGGSGPLRDDTAYILRPGHAPAKCMDVNQFGKSEGTSVQQWSCFSQANQVFWARDYGSGRFALRNAVSAKCVQVAMASSTVGAPIRQANCSGAAHQLWRPVAAGNRFQLVSELSGFVIDVAGTESMTDGELLAQQTSDGLLDSTWTAEVATRGAYIAFSIPGQTGTRAARMDAEVRMQATNGPEAQWKVHPGLASSGCVSFESRETPGEFMRRSGEEIRTEPFESGSEFAGDATFCYRAPLEGTDIVLHALESLNLSGYYVTREGDTVGLAPFADTSAFRTAATWHVREPL